MSRSPSIAAVTNREGVDSQTVLEEAVADWTRSGLRIVGLLAENRDVEGVCSAAFLRDITSGQRFSIELDAAPAGTVCHLDIAGLGRACAELLPRIPGADLVILSKFGKTEAAGGGLLAAFSATIAANRPLLTTVSDKHAQSWTEFAPEMVRLEPDLQTLRRWRDRILA